MANILLTSVGRRVELVRAFRAAYTEFDIPGSIVATDIDWLAPAIHFVDRPFIAPRTNDEGFPAAIEQICRTQNVDLVLPLIDPDIPVLAGNQALIESTGARLAVVETPAAEIASDKWLASEFFVANEIPSPKSWLPDDSGWKAAEFPLFIKPRRGSAAENTFMAESVDELCRLVPKIDSPIIQEFLPGPEITCDIVTNLQGGVMAIVQRQRISVRGGEAIKSFTISDPSIEAACRKIAGRLPAKGPITAQCMMKNGVPHFIEINARVGGGLPLAIAAGVNVPAMLLSLVESLPKSALKSEYQVGMYMTRCDESVFLTEGDRDKIKCDHL